jgi:hypothetical protein
LSSAGLDCWPIGAGKLSFRPHRVLGPRMSPGWLPAARPVRRTATATAGGPHSGVRLTRRDRSPPTILAARRRPSTRPG